jgi:hypothetical protein
LATVKDVTIIIPVHVRTDEALDWLSDCFESASVQGCKVLAWDDASPVDVTSVADFYKVKLLKNGQHGGVAYARNQLVMYADTPLILPLDCDDMLAAGAVNKMLTAWDGNIPVYSDVEFIGQRTGHYKLKDFTCEELRRAVGLAPVTVLHRRDQWRYVGGWDETLALYEDGVYNAKLLGTFCGVRIPLPLVLYRQHPNQRSKSAKGLELARQIHSQYISAMEVDEMACCGGRRATSSSPRTTVNQMTASDAAQQRVMNTSPQFFHQATPTGQSTSLPGTTEERVRARYLGGHGKGAHYYRGRVSGFAYKVVYGSELMADARDVVWSEGEVGVANGLLLGLERPKGQQAQQGQPEKPTFFKQEAEPKPQAREEVERTPLVLEEDEPVEEEEDEGLPDVFSMYVEEIEELDVTPEVAAKLLELELNGKNRKGAIAALKAKMEGDL